MDFLHIENAIGTLSYGLCASLFGALFIRLFMQQGVPNPVRKSMAFAALFTALWACASVMLFSLDSVSLFGWVTWMETLRNIAWLHVLLVIIASVQRSALKLLSHWIWSVRILIAVQLGLAALMSWHQTFEWMAWYYLVGMLFAVTALVLTEQLIRNANQAQRWQVKFFGVACVLVFGFDFLLYSQSVLKGHVQTSWLEARGAVTTLAAPLVYLYIVRQAKVPRIVSLSHTAVFHTSMLLLASGYLILMALAGYYFKFVGGGWGEFFSIVFFASGCVGLLLLLFSGSTRARVWVFVRRHFLSLQYDYREEWWKVTKALSEARELWPLTRKIVTLLSDCVESTGGAIWVRNEVGRFSLINNGVFTFPSVCPSQALEGLVQYWETSDRIIVLPEVQTQPELKEALKLPDWFAGSGLSWLVIPLKAQQELQGFVLLAQPRTPIALNWEIFDYIKVVASQAAVQLAVARATEQIASTQRFEAVHQMSAFFVHDMKTMVSQLSMMTKNADRHMDNPDFIRDMLDTVSHAVKKMERILQHLKSAKVERAVSSINLAELLTDVLKKVQPEPAPKLSIELEGPATVRADYNALVSALVNLIVNAQEAVRSNVQDDNNSLDHGELVKVVLKQYNSEQSPQNTFLIEILDQGGGMSPEFLQEKLFKPFNSTKGLTGMGIGLYQSKASIEACGGEVFVESALGQGTVINILLPELLSEESDSLPE